MQRYEYRDISELRLRCGGLSSVTVWGRNIAVDVRLTSAEMSDCVTALCRGSVYAHADTIGNGYICFGNGIRIGVCGTFSSAAGGVREFGSLNIRLPHMIRNVSDFVLNRCLSEGGIRSALLYSPPGIGKTTVLRDVAAVLGGRYKKRVAVIDCRGEIYMEEMFRDSLCDVFVGYPKALGIEIATRTMAPEVIICDELGDECEAKQILSAQNTGVPFIAAAHASDTKELLSRPNIRILHENGVFFYYIGVARQYASGALGSSFEFSCALCEDVK